MQQAGVAGVNALLDAAAPSIRPFYSPDSFMREPPSAIPTTLRQPDEDAARALLVEIEGVSGTTGTLRERTGSGGFASRPAAEVRGLSGRIEDIAAPGLGRVEGIFSSIADATKSERR